MNIIDIEDEEYTAFIETGKRGKNYASTGSIPLKKDKLIDYVKRNPVGNRNTKVLITKVRTGETKLIPKWKFR